jgi:hypothetical protein
MYPMTTSGTIATAAMIAAIDHGNTARNRASRRAVTFSLRAGFT